MRLNKIKIAGFKSFVDPTTVQLPSNLSGVVGPNGCGKSNIIDAVRWVMGELSARHLRGDSMADVIFNGSSARKPVGTASVELVFDNSDGKITGPYAAFNEISLKRVVSRDGSSSYFINGGRCRRKDITQLFLGTGLGSRSYAIIEQGMISRVIEAKPEDLRAFLEEAAGISLYKERRKETEARISDTRENLDRLQDLRDEVDKQIRHLQRQAGVARKYQDLKAQERQLTAELLALRLRDLDSGVELQDSTVRERELAMQQALAEQRSAEAGIERQREFHTELTDSVSAVQGRYYEIGAEVTRSEESIRYARELRERQRNDLAQVGHNATRLADQVQSDELALAALQEELNTLEPEVQSHQQAEQECVAKLAEAESRLTDWQQRWEALSRELGGANQSSQVEAARIEQLEGQLRRLRTQLDRIEVERAQLGQQEAQTPLAGLTEQEANARDLADELSAALQAALQRAQQLRAQQHDVEAQLEQRRRDRERTRAELMSLEALQQAALSEKNAGAHRWLEGLGGRQQRLAEQLDVEAGWERAVETALGDYLEAVCVGKLDSLESALGRLDSGQLTFIEAQLELQGPGAGAVQGSLAARVQGSATAQTLLAGVRTCETLSEALRERTRLAAGESIITRGGEWLGRSWLRVSRGGDAHSGVLEREQRIKQLRGGVAALDEGVQQQEEQLQSLRSAAVEAERGRDEVQARIQAAHRDHAELRGKLEAMKARLEEARLRRARLDAEGEETQRETQKADEALSRARQAYETAVGLLSRLDEQRLELEEGRQQAREDAHAQRASAQSAQLALRDMLIRTESKRTAHSGVSAALVRMHEQRAQLEQRQQELAGQLAEGDAPIVELEGRLQESLARRVEVESELAAARRSLEDAERELRALDQRRMGAEERVTVARDAMEQARLAAQESRVRRESLLEQFAATRCELAVVLGNLAAEAEIGPWETRIAGVQADIEKLGQVNLAAIDELKEQSERKTYLDRQFTDVSDALNTLEEAMRKIEKETRSRFEDTFNRVNAGLQEKFPKLFGGGHAYLELAGDDALSSGVAVMARPPGKRNSTISQLSGGEKALTAVALVFSIFDLNPAPFCLLDEVDAPLDEHNVGRFCDIVRQMSERVQFIFITHNKATMQLASQLLGVTMNEPGVSRLVAVDLDEAVKLAAV
ncbi:MAG: chromosome segregation protein SMC [Steroidobacteraceae bacterium]